MVGKPTGVHAAIAAGGARHGSIPACAGEPRAGGLGVDSRPRRRRCPASEDQQARRRYGPGRGRPRAAPGSPTALRGRTSPGSGRPRSDRSIPACAGEPRPRGPRRTRARVYPRVCGGTRSVQATPPCFAGLSPRVRGNRRWIPVRRSDPGSIPACAGEPFSLVARAGRVRVYPRVCGGTSTAPREKCSASGLSPRVRGNRLRGGLPLVGAGSIPACAGEPEAERRVLAQTRVYPRVCGGTQTPEEWLSLDSGLSPRVRGNPLLRQHRRARRGSIPACAGEPRGRTTSGRISRVYPRVCGGTRRRITWPARRTGLSPRVRGNRGPAGGRGHGAGSIPACAGEPSAPRSKRSPRRVYPRVCGGTANSKPGTVGWLGLSPRVRGNPCSKGGARHDRGSIPACAGEPARADRNPVHQRVYPRVCGGTWLRCTCIRKFPGLSPRVRGNRMRGGVCVAVGGSIPACAGEPPSRRSCRACGTVYPRVCGGTGAGARRAAGSSGLSPRVRGNQGRRGDEDVLDGSIPACAGEPAPPSGPARR